MLFGRQAPVAKKDVEYVIADYKDYKDTSTLKASHKATDMNQVL